jgi:hypothetical protein
MSGKPRRRKKVRRARKVRRTFRIMIEAQPVVVEYEPHWMTDMAKFEFRSPYKPPRRIPVSETGYYCHFASMEEVEAAQSPQDFARDEALALLPWRHTTKDRRNVELPLF